MAEKNRKVSSSSSAQAPKKVKGAGAKSKDGKQETVAEVADASSAEVSASTTKKPRKRAADFLDDEPEQMPPKKGKKSAKESKPEAASLTADGSNGVVESKGSENVKIATAKKAKKGSMMAEAEATQDQEMADEFGDAQEQSVDEEIDSAPALLAGFDSDNDDPAEDKDFDASRVAPIPQFKKTSKKLRQAKAKSNEGPGTVYVGRIPHGFYETQMREYFSQFGDISRLRLSRNKKTGASKHFAFIEFEIDEVAKIVAESMDNYLMFGHILKCKYAPTGSLHDDVWKGANRRYRRIPHHKLLKNESEKPQTIESLKKKNAKVQSKRLAQQEKAKALGYEYDLPELKGPEVTTISNVESEPEQKTLEDKVEGTVVPPGNIPKDEVAILAEETVNKTSKKSKKSKKSKDEAVDDETAQMPTSTAEGRRKAKKLEAEIKPTLPVEAAPAATSTKRKAASEATAKPTKKEGKQPKSILKKPKKN